MKDFLSLPLIPISDKRVVHIGVDKDYLTILLYESESLRNIVIPLHKMYDIPLIMDMDGILSYSPQLEIVKKIARSFPIWFDGGARFSDDIIDFLVADVERCCISTKTIDSIKELEDAVSLSDKLCLMLDIFNGEVLTRNKALRRMTLSDLAYLVEDLGIEYVLYIDYNQLIEMKMDTKNLEPFLTRSIRLFVAGLSPARIEKWREIGIRGLILYYRTIFDFKKRKLRTDEEELYTLAPEESRRPVPHPHAQPVP